MAVTHRGTESWFVQYHPEYDLGYYSALIANRRERMVGLGFFQSTDDLDRYVSELQALHEDSTREWL